MITDNEIKKALECCWHNNECIGNECPFFEPINDCTQLMAMEAIDLLNRKDAEIEKLEIELKAMRGAANSYKAEVERLQKEVEQFADIGKMGSEKKMVYFPFPIDCEKCPKATDIGVCEELDLLYNGEHPKYTRAQDWEFMCDTCPYEVHGRKYREEDDKDFIGKTLFFTEEEAERALNESYSDERIYKA